MEKKPINNSETYLVVAWKIVTPSRTPTNTLKSTQIEAERLVVLRNSTVMLVFRFYELPWYLPMVIWVHVLLLMAKLSSSTSFGFSFQEEKFEFYILPSYTHLTMWIDGCVLLPNLIGSVGEGGASSSHILLWHMGSAGSRRQPCHSIAEAWSCVTC